MVLSLLEVAHDLVLVRIVLRTTKLTLQVVQSLIGLAYLLLEIVSHHLIVLLMGGLGLILLAKILIILLVQITKLLLLLILHSHIPSRWHNIIVVHRREVLYVYMDRWLARLIKVGDLRHRLRPT